MYIYICIRLHVYMRMCKTQSIHWASIHTPVAGCLLLDDWQCGSGDESPHGYEET